MNKSTAALWWHWVTFGGRFNTWSKATLLWQTSGGPSLKGTSQLNKNQSHGCGCDRPHCQTRGGDGTGRVVVVVAELTSEFNVADFLVQRLGCAYHGRTKVVVGALFTKKTYKKYKKNNISHMFTQCIQTILTKIKITKNCFWGICNKIQQYVKLFTLYHVFSNQ